MNNIYLGNIIMDPGLQLLVNFIISNPKKRYFKILLYEKLQT